MSGPRSALIIGAGIGGLTTALALAKDGWRVRICEQNEILSPVGAGLQISPNASRILLRLGILDKIRTIAVAPQSLVIREGSNGRSLGGLALGVTAEKRWGAPFLVAHRGDLQGALLELVSQQSTIAIETGHRLERLILEKAAAKAVLLHRGNEVQVDADLIIGADGLWSKTRNLIGLPGPTTFSGCVAWRALVPASRAPEHACILRSNLWLGPAAHVVHYPVRAGSAINIVAIVEQAWQERGWSEPGESDWINNRFASWHPDLRGLMGSVESWQRWSLFDRAPEQRWTRGPVALLGDAAHPMLPFMAQGAAQAIEDAAGLTAALHENADIPGALRTYEQARLRRTAQIQRLSRRQALAYHASGPFVLARNLVMKALGEAGMARRYDWIYGHCA